MISIEEALSIIHNQKISPTTRELHLSESRGFHLAEKIAAPFDLPSFDNSAMDGYAVCGLREDYQIVGEVAAGDTADVALSEGEAMRIFTGGKIPQNTTAVVMQEKTQVTDHTVRVLDPVRLGQNIRRRGEELSENQEVFSAGHFITPASIGLIGSLGLEKIKVFQKPSVALISTGNELIAPGQQRKPGQIYESNSLSLTAALRQYGFDCAEKQQIEDQYDKIRQGIGHCLEKFDVLLLSGGISVGDYDFVKQALIENGVEELFYKIFQKPGKPLFFGRKDHRFVFALPGNPASALTCFYIYVLPLLQRLSGNADGGLMQVQFPLAHGFTLRGDRPSFLKAAVSNQQVAILDGQGSSMIHSMAMGNALAYIDKPGELQRGDLVRCMLIS